MLEKLTIQNYALIDKVELTFSPGLTTITGETGAGKSIMLGALSLLRGGRADTRVVTDRDAKSVVEGVFSEPDPTLEQFFVDNELDWNPDEIIIRREVTGAGRSRAFVNDAPVNLSILAELSSHLIDIHSQHENVMLTDPKMQLAVIDAFSDNDDLRAEYSREYARFNAIRARIKKAKEELDATRRNRDFLAFQLEGLEALKPKRGELAEIERRFDLLSNADETREELQELCAIFGSNDRGVVDMLYKAKGIAAKLEVSTLSERLENLLVEAKDIYETAVDELAEVESDPQTLEQLSKRMQDYYAAVKHYRVKDADALEELHRDIIAKLNAMESDADLSQLEKSGREAAARVKELGERLTESRNQGAAVFGATVLIGAVPLGLPNLRFEVDMSVGKLGSNGQDRVEFLTAFNKNQPSTPIAGQASGGEMARLMLSIKRGLAGRMNLPTVIFDEIDTGVSGEIAHKMGEMMQEMGRDMQVMTITHLPQVAAKGVEHLKVYKQDEGERTVSHVRRLDREERIRELAAMMSGSEVGDAALNNARALLGYN